MKNRAWKKFIAIASAVTLLVSLWTAAPVSAAVTPSNTLPVYDDYNDYDDASYDAWKNQGDTPLKVVWNGTAERVLSVKNDPDIYSGHGKVLELTNTGTEGFLAYSIPDQANGQLCIEFDIKSLGGYMSLSPYPNANDWSGYNPVITFNENSVSTGTTTTAWETCNLNTWYTVRILLDQTQAESGNQKNRFYTVFFNGKSASGEFYQHAENLKNDKVGLIKFMTRKGTSGATFYLDNLKIYSVTETAVPVTLSGNGQSITQFADLTDQLTLSLDDAVFLTAPDGITLSDLGSNLMQAEPSQVVVTSSLNKDGTVQLKLGSALLQGHNYQLTIPSSVTDLYGRKLNKYTMIFRGATGGDTQVVQHVEEDFSKVTQDTINNGRNNGVAKLNSNIGTTGLLRYHSQAGSIAPQILEGPTYSGGKALLITGQIVQLPSIWLAGAPDNAKGANRGRVVLEGTMAMRNAILTQASHGSASPSQGVSFMGTHKNDNGMYYRFRYYNPDSLSKYGDFLDGPHDETSIWATNPEERQMMDMRYVLDYDTKKAYVHREIGSDVLDKTFEMPTYESNGNVLKDGRNYWINMTTNSSDNWILLDDLSFTYEYTPYTAVSAKILDAEGTEQEYTGPVSLFSKGVKVQFSGNMKQDTLNNITVAEKSNGNKVNYTGSYDATTYTYTMNFEQGALKAETEYTITIPGDTVLDYAGLPIAHTVVGQFKTATATFGWDNLQILDAATDKPISSFSELTGTQVKLSIDVVNETENEVSAELVCAGYDNDRLTKASVQKVTANPKTPKQTLTTTAITVKNGEDIVNMVKAFAMQDMKNIIPLCAAAEI